jgi:lipopolysaccharide export system protein LptA
VWRLARPLALVTAIGLIVLPRAGTAEEAPPPQAEATAPPLPIEVEAEQGIEWFRDERRVYARGNARAVRGEVTVSADVLGALYRDRPDGGQEVFRLDAEGNVTITTPGQTMTGVRGVYDLDTGVLRLFGAPARMVSGNDSIAAHRELEYTTKAQTIVARGDAAATQGDRQIKAQELIAFLQRKADGGSTLQRLEATTPVTVITPKEVIRSNRGTYNVADGTATFIGDVRVTRGANQLNGCRGELDLNAGVSRLMSCGVGAPPVRGLILPGASGDGERTGPR